MMGSCRPPTPVLLCCFMAAVLICTGTGAQAQSSTNDWVRDGSLAKQLCASPDFKQLTCGLMGDAEQEATLKHQCWNCGNMWRALQETLPAELTGHSSYFQYLVKPLSLACQGPVVVRTVFKILQDRAFAKADQRDCTNFALTDDKGSSTVVRCELELPPGGGSEAERALKAKEAKCWLCEQCSKGRGCPNSKDKWYSDSFIHVAEGCSFNAAKGYAPTKIGAVLNPEAKVLLAKFEACSSGSCFDPAYEQQKRQSARQCVKGVCA